MWDMYRSIPSLEIEGASYLDEFYWLDQDDPNSSNTRLIYKRGQRVPTDGKYELDDKAMELVKLVMTPESKLGRQTLEDFFTPDFFESNFWSYWATMFAFENGTQQLRCVVMQCDSFITLMGCLTLPH